MLQTQVSTKYQVVIPKEIRKKISIKPGQKLRVSLSDGRITLSPTKTKKKLKWPDEYIEKLGNIWKDVDSKKYLEEERNSWDD